MDATRIAELKQQVRELERELSRFLARAVAAMDQERQQDLIDEAASLHANAILLRQDLEGDKPS